MKKNAVLALSASTLLVLAGCASNSSETAGSSSAASETPQMDTTGHDQSVPATSSSSSTSENTWTSKVSPTPDPARAWGQAGLLRFGANDVVVDVSVESGHAGFTTLKGLDAKTGKSRWNIDLTEPPLGLKDSSANVRQVGDALAVIWSGTSGGSTLEAGTTTTVSALCDIATGKQRGKPTQIDGTVDDSSTPFRVRVARGYSFADGTTVTSDETQADEYNGQPWLPEPGGELYASVVDATSTLSVVNEKLGYAPEGATSSSTLQIWDRVNKRKLTQTKCSEVDTSNPVVSPNGRFAVFGGAAVDLTKRDIWCIKSPAKGTKIKLVSDSGTLYGEGNSRLYTQAWGQGKSTILPENATLPQFALESATVYGIEDSPEGPGIVSVRTK